jgi:hypothetical protein
MPEGHTRRAHGAWSCTQQNFVIPRAGLARGICFWFASSGGHNKQQIPRFADSARDDNERETPSEKQEGCSSSRHSQLVTFFGCPTCRFCTRDLGFLFRVADHGTRKATLCLGGRSFSSDINSRPGKGLQPPRNLLTSSLTVPPPSYLSSNLAPPQVDQSALAPPSQPTTGGRAHKSTRRHSHHSK